MRGARCCGDLLGQVLQFDDRPAWRTGPAGAMTLRSTSPQAPSVLSRQSLMPAMVGLRFALEDAVQLNALPGGDAQGAVGVLAGQVVDGEVLLRP